MFLRMKSVLMPLRAFIDSDFQKEVQDDGYDCVLMPLRAFIDSDFSWRLRPLAPLRIGLNALTGIY